MLRTKMLALGITLVMSLTACSLSLAADVTPPPDFRPPSQQAPVTSQTSVPLLPPDVANGQSLYEQKCVDCHGPKGMGNGSKAANLPNPAAPLGDPQFAGDKLPVDWFNIITNGNIEYFMPGFQSLNDRERWDVTAYALSLSMAFDPSETKTSFEENCSNCHAPGNDLGIVDFLDAGYLANMSQTNIESVIQNGNSAGMPAFNQRFDQQNFADMAAYIRSLGYRNFVSSDTPPADNPDSDLPEAQIMTPVPMTDTQKTFTVVGNIQNLDIVPTGLVIRLSGFDDMSMVFQQENQVEEDGSYQFPNLEMADGRVYQLAAMIEGIEYTSEVLHSPQADENGEVNLPLVVTTTTTDASALIAERLHVFFDFIGEDTVQVVELYVINNPSEQTIIAENGDTPIVTYTLPEGAQNLQFEQGSIGTRFIETENGFGDLQPVDANTSTQFLFAYELPYQNKLDLSLNLPLPVQAAVFMLPSNSVEIKSDQLIFDGNRSVQGMNILTYSATDLAGQSVLELQLVGKVKVSSATVGNSMLGTIIGASVLLLALLLAGYWFLWRKPSPMVPIVTAEAEDLDTLLDAVIALDDAYKNGDLSMSAYQVRRNELLTQIDQTQKRD